MKTYLNLVLGATTLAFEACNKSAEPEVPAENATVSENRFEAADGLLASVAANLSGFETIAVIDHARLAEKEGVEMPPEVVTLYSKPSVNIALMKLNPRVGLDLPQKALVFEESGEAKIVYPSSEFLAARHALTDAEALGAYDLAIKAGLEGISGGIITPVGSDKVVKDYGITELVSDFPHAESIVRLKEAVMSQGDTVWFGEIDLKSEAAAAGESLPKATLLLFGGPKPGGVAMAKFPKLGLDAFCQKLLVYEEADGVVKVIFNNIVSMAELHYGTSAKPHEVINGRLAGTFESAVRKGTE